MNTMKKLFFASISENINIKRRFFLIVFCPYFGKYQYFEEITVFLDHLEIVMFAHIAVNINILRKRNHFEKGFFANTSSENFFDRFFLILNICVDLVFIIFFSTCQKKSRFQKKLRYFEITLKILFFAHISKNIDISSKTFF